MTPKKHSRTNLISDNDILAMYEAIVPLLSENREELDLGDCINKRLLLFVRYDFYHYLMDTPNATGSHGRLGFDFERWGGFEADTIQQVTIHPSSHEDANAEFEESIERNYENILARQIAMYPKLKEYDYHRIESKTHPRIVLGFFRRKDIPANGFTLEEKNIFDQLAPHLFSLYRAVLYQVFLSQGFQYFNSFSQIGSKIASDFHLSEAEVRLLPDILFGLNNEAIAGENFISVETVKSHIKHILKKTGTKNRIDFVGKFFTSPEHVQL